MITLVTLFESALNLNGDQANVSVLGDYLERCGLEVRKQNVESASQLVKLKPDFVFIGHGSAAAHRQIDSELLAMATQLKNLDCPIMFVGSGVELATEALSMSVAKIQRGERESLFAVGELEGFRVLGYRNTDSGLVNIWRENNRLFSMLHGPVLAKNPKLLFWVANQIASAKPTEKNLQWISKLNEVCHRIWQLETKEPFEKLELS